MLLTSISLAAGASSGLPAMRRGVPGVLGLASAVGDGVWEAARGTDLGFGLKVEGVPRMRDSEERAALNFE